MKLTKDTIRTLIKEQLNKARHTLAEDASLEPPEVRAFGDGPDEVREAAWVREYLTLLRFLGSRIQHQDYDIRNDIAAANVAYNQLKNMINNKMNFRKEHLDLMYKYITKNVITPLQRRMERAQALNNRPWADHKMQQEMHMLYDILTAMQDIDMNNYNLPNFPFQTSYKT